MLAALSLSLLILCSFAINAAQSDRPPASAPATASETGERVVIVSIDATADPAARTLGISDAGIRERVIANAIASSATADNQGITILHRLATSNGFIAKASPAAIRALLATPGVSVRTDRIFEQQLDGSVPLINANDLWNRTVNNAPLRGDGTTLCVIDGGIDYAHPAFADRIAASRCLLPSGCPDPSDESNATDDQASGHGTHMAGILVGNGTYTGVAPGAKLLVAKVCDSAGSCYLSSMVAAMDWCANVSDDYNLSAISMSISDAGYYDSVGACPYDDGLDGAINAAWQKGVLVAIAAGNGRTSRGIGYPSCNPNATSVSSSTKQDALSTDRIGNLLKILAPTNVNCAAKGGGYSESSGTSAATPHVAGIAALLAENERMRGRTLTPGFLDTLLVRNGANVSNWTRVDALIAYLARESNASVNTSTNTAQVAGAGSLKFQSATDWSEFDACVVMNNNLVSVNSAACPQFNKSASITFTSLSIPHHLSGPLAIFADGVFCRDCVAGDYNASAGTFSFNVSHFTSYTAGLITNLTIWDQADAMPYGGAAANAGESIGFYANFTNATSQPAATANGACQIDFANPTYDGYEAMTYDVVKKLFVASHSFADPGTINYKINCTGQGENLETSDSVIIGPAHKPVPEFGTWALMLALGLTIGGFVALRRA